jgi:hypothetical protein
LPPSIWQSADTFAASIGRIVQIDTREERIRLLNLFFPKAKHKHVGAAAETEGATLKFVACGVNAVVAHLCFKEETVLEMAESIAELEKVFAFSCERFRENGFGQIPRRLWEKYIACYTELVCRKLSANLQRIYVDLASVPLSLRPEALHLGAPDYLANMVSHCSGICLGQEHGNAENALIILQEVGEYQRRMSMRSVPSGYRPINMTIGRFNELTRLYNFIEKFTMLNSFASKNYPTAFTALIASAQMGVPIPFTFWNALAAEPNFTGKDYANFDARQLIYNSPVVSPQVRAADQTKAFEFFDRLRETDDVIKQILASSVIADLTIFKDMFRDHIEWHIGEETVISSLDIRASYSPVEAVLSALLETFPREVALRIFRTICFYPWAQGECPRVILAAKDTLANVELPNDVKDVHIAQVFDLFSDGRGKIVILVRENGTVEIISMSAQGGPLKESIMARAFGYVWDHPYSFFYTHLIADPFGGCEISEAMMAYHT